MIDDIDESSKFFNCLNTEKWRWSKNYSSNGVMSVNEIRDINNSQSGSNVLCSICGREFTTSKGYCFTWMRVDENSKNSKTND